MKVRLLGTVTVARCLVLLLSLALLLLALLILPWIWLTPFGRFGRDPILRFLVYLNLLMFWTWSHRFLITDIQALRAKRKLLANPLWSVDLPAGRQPLAAELIAFVESKVSKSLRGRLQISLSVVPGVEYQKISGWGRQRWRMTLGFSTLAVLSVDEIKALALLKGSARFSLANRSHFWLATFLKELERWRSALPPHPGFFTFTRWAIDGSISILRSIPGQLSSLSAIAARKEFAPATIFLAQGKMWQAGNVQAAYVKLYHSLNEGALMPPYTEGISRLCRKTIGGIPPEPAFTRVEGLWVYERQFLENAFGQDYIRHLQPVNWADLPDDFSIAGWRAAAALIRPLINSSLVNDLPGLIADWRAVLKRWYRSIHRAPVLTPDRQRELLVSVLSFVFAVALLDAGWRLCSTLGEEPCLINEMGKLHPFHLVKALGDGLLTEAQFIGSCHTAGVSELPLGTNYGTAAAQAH